MDSQAVLKSKFERRQIQEHQNDATSVCKQNRNFNRALKSPSPLKITKEKKNGATPARIKNKKVSINSICKRYVTYNLS